MKSVKKYLEIMKITISNNLVYFFSFIARNFFFVFIMFVFLMLWSNIYSGREGLIGGFSLNMMIWYLVVTEVVTLSRPNVHLQINNDIKQGSIAYILNKPYNYILYNLSLFTGELSLRFFINLVTGLGVGFVFVGALEGFNLIHFPFIIFSIVIGCYLNFIIFMNLALTAFWFEDNQAFFWIYSKLVFILGGMLIPLDMFPDWLQVISRSMPFAYIAYIPGKLAVDFSYEMFSSQVPIQIVYALVFTITAELIYRRGAKSLNVNGG